MSTTMELSPVDLYVVTDIDDVLAVTAPAILADIERVTKTNIGLDKFSEDFPTMLGMSYEDACEWWLDFCNRMLPELEPAHGSQQAVEHITSFAIMDSLTSRRPDFAAITTTWIQNNFATIRQTRHAAIPWASDRQAHRMTKAEDLDAMQPDVFWDDQPKHAIANASAGRYTILVDAYGWNSDMELPPNMQYAPNTEVAAELTERYSELLLSGEAR